MAVRQCRVPETMRPSTFTVSKAPDAIALPQAGEARNSLRRQQKSYNDRAIRSFMISLVPP
jgi:hypothetical protein